MALRTNSKQAKANLWKYIRAYMLDEMNDAREYAESNGEPFNYDDSNNGVACYMLDRFADEYLHNYNRQLLKAGRVTSCDLFESWAQGLALGGMFCYYYNREAVQDVAQILEETEAEAGRFTEEQAERFLTRYIFDTIRKEADRYFL